jgi:Ca-activated chloride channel family protein
MEWGHPQNLIWLWVVPAAGMLFFLASFRRKAELKRFGDLALVQRLVLSFSPTRRLWKQLLILGALTCMVLALAQPHLRKKETLVERKGVDIMIAIDVSNSMLARDVAPNRLEKAKLELAGLVDKLKGNRIGIVAFAGEAVIQCPLTLDHNAVKLFLSTISPNLISFQGTNIGKAIAVATQAFQDKEKDSKAVILLTDGEDHDPETKQFVQRAKAAGVRIYTIGIGTADGSTVPEDSAKGFKKDSQGQVVLSRLDESFLKQVARETSGVYYRSTRGELEVDNLAREIRRMTQKGFKNDWSVEYEEEFQYFLILALIFLTTELCLSERKKIQ